LSRRPAGSVRIEAGALKGRNLAVPRGARPTEGRVRGALFSIWSDRIERSRFLDLFAGSGAVGLEALSRGALAAVFVESDRDAADLLARNLRLASAGAARLLRGELPAALARLRAEEEPFDLLFADPPYAWTVTDELLGELAPLARSDAELIVEHARRTPPPAVAAGWVRRDLRRYGESALSIYGRTA
jgi:16S rRNA (guanine(966)-N(2))-methyltransferase RsmD